MSIESCMPVIPCADLEASLRLWVDGLGFEMDNEMRSDEGRLIYCMLRNGKLTFMLNQRVGSTEKPDNYEGIRLYWAPSDIHESRRNLARLGFKVSDIDERDYGMTEFFLRDDDGHSHCFGFRQRARNAC